MSGVAELRALYDALPPELSRHSVLHASWTNRRSESYERLAFLGDSVLSLAVTTHLFPRLQADQYGAGRLTKVRAQAVSGRACRVVAERMGLDDALRATAPEGTPAAVVDSLATTERVLASIIEAVIGACYLHFGFEQVAPAVVAAFADRIDESLQRPADFKSALQERLARKGAVVGYEVRAERGPPHDRTFDVAAVVAGEELAVGSGRSKKDAEQAAAETALGAMEAVT